MHEQSIETQLGKRRHDAARYRGDGQLRKFREYKSGERLNYETLGQLAKDWDVLKNNPGTEGVWLIGARTWIDPAVRKQMERMQREFGERFRVERLSRQQMAEAKRLGRELERERESGQMELFSAKKLREQQRERDRKRADEERERTREHAARAEKQRAEERERAQRLERQAAIEERERKLRAQLPGASDDVVRALARSGPLPNEANRAQRDAAERTMRAGREAQQQRDRDRGRDGRGRGD
ncbi:DUF1682 domain-containing protein [Nocardia yunnanensis]|uniref:DUF1682 domain-containing protein n=1 Tax=Nocardia yunnanensis TaxID=2382165 RepID=UPI0013C3F1D0|nr:DUF1682 domain-containing protein [Nocardia yunnanensis]